MDALSGIFARVRDGKPTCVIIGGEAGVGKSRLVSEFTQQEGENGATVLTGGCIELAGSGIPFAPITEALRGLLHGLDVEKRAVLTSERCRELTRLLPELEGSEDPTKVDEVTDRGRSRLFDAFLALLEQLGDEAPVLVVVEDLHWADDSTRDLLTFVVHNLRTERALLCLTYRNDELHRRHPMKAWLARALRENVVERFDLGPLDHTQIAEQVSGILGEQPDDDLMALVSARSDGNPLFTEELVAASLAQVESGLPPTLVDLLVSRFETLSERTQEVMPRCVGGRA